MGKDEGLREGRIEGRIEGKKEERLNTIRNLQESGMSFDEICGRLKFSEQEIKEYHDLLETERK